MTDYGLGRRHAPDPRDQNYLLRRLLPEPGKVALPVQKTWRIAPTSLDQGRTSTCVGQAWKNFLRCAPMRTERTGPSAQDIYRAAVRIDEWAENDDEAGLPDNAPGLDFGTSVRAGAKALALLGRLDSYVWAFDLQTTLEWVLTKGPVVLGTNWYSSFMRPDAKGFVRIEPGARWLGGHAYLLRAVDTRKAVARCVNSWGDAWGLSGEFIMSLRDLETLIRENGEACSAIERKPVKAVG